MAKILEINLQNGLSPANVNAATIKRGINLIKAPDTGSYCDAISAD